MALPDYTRDALDRERACQEVMNAIVERLWPMIEADLRYSPLMSSDDLRLLILDIIERDEKAPP